MVEVAPASGAQGGRRKISRLLSSKIRIVITILVIVLILFGVWAKFIHKNNSAAPSTEATPAQIEDINKSQTNDFLKSKNYTSYQDDRQTLAIEYLTNSKPTDAERVMDDVLNNVPTNQINSGSYSVLYQVEKAKSNVTLEKKYLGLLISSLKSEGSNTAAAAAQVELDKLQ